MSLLCLSLLLLVQDPAAPAPVLGPPQRILAGGEPITAITGHAAPYVYDFDRDGTKDLVVGEFGDAKGKGRARVYLNLGSDAAPRFEDFSYLKAAGEFARVPSS